MHRGGDHDPVSAHEPAALGQDELAAAKVEVVRPERSKPGVSLPLGEPEEKAPDRDGGRALQQEFEPSRREVRKTFQKTVSALERHALRHVLQQLGQSSFGRRDPDGPKLVSPGRSGGQEGRTRPPFGVRVSPGGGEPSGASSAEGLGQVAAGSRMLR